MDRDLRFVLTRAARVEKITQAILAKAFRGELVPTEAEPAHQEAWPYEPVTVFLARILAARSPQSVDNKSARSFGRNQHG